MKRILPFFLSFALLHAASNAIGQCAISDVVVNNERSVNPVGENSCGATFDVSFTLENNRGNKFIFIHAWLQSAYPNYFNCGNGDNQKNPPLRANLAAAFLNFAIDNSGNTPKIVNNYAPDPTVVVNTAASLEIVELTGGKARYTIRGLSAVLPVPCGTPFSIIADVWSSQSAKGQTVHCVSCNIGFKPFGITGTANCATLRYTAAVTNTSSNSFTGAYTVFADINGDRKLTAADALVQAATTFTIASGATQNIGGSIPNSAAGRDLFFVVTAPGGDPLTSSNTGLLITTECAILPVRFVSFSATRQGNAVLLKWETATEENNKGFYVERQNGNGDWADIQLVASKAADGNSNELLSYNFTDVNGEIGFTQYRLRQVDIDGKTRYSEIRSVAGIGQKARTMVYPNPSMDGAVNIVFENATSSKNVFITDVNGRIVKQWKNITASNLSVDQLTGGLYMVRIVDNAGGTTTTQKVIVNKY